MPDYWIDADSLIRPHRGAYRFNFGTVLWDFLASKAEEGVLACPEIVLNNELTGSNTQDDALANWAKGQRGTLFLPAEAPIQIQYARVVNYVQSNGRFGPEWIASWLDGADPWLVAYPLALGGRIVTFEKSASSGRKPKIPDVADNFGIQCFTIWQMLEELGFKN